MMIRILILVVSIFVASCGQETPYTVHNIALSPQTIPSFITNKKNLALQVADTRTDAVVGYRRFGFEKESPVIVQDTGPVLLAALERDLRSAGFNPVSYNIGSNTSLDVKIINISYENKGRVITGNQKTIIRVQAIAKNGTNIMTRNFDTKSFDTDLMRPSQSHQATLIDKGVSTALEKVVAKILTDVQFMTFLQQGA